MTALEIKARALQQLQTEGYGGSTSFPSRFTDAEIEAALRNCHRWYVTIALQAACYNYWEQIHGYGHFPHHRRKSSEPWSLTDREVWDWARDLGFDKATFDRTVIELEGMLQPRECIAVHGRRMTEIYRAADTFYGRKPR